MRSVSDQCCIYHDGWCDTVPADMDKTIEYYNQNADMFVQGTRLVDFAVVQERFAKMLPVGSRILDFGCGSG